MFFENRGIFISRKMRKCQAARNAIKENKDMNIKKELETKVGIANGIYLNDIEIDLLTN